MKLDDLFDLNLFQQMQDEKMITLRNHEEFSVVIANYSDQAQYKQCWNDVTLNCRGLIYDPRDNRIIARPWKKFFNLGDAKAPYIGFDDLVEVTDKLDGSLGILWIDFGGRKHIATRGSFYSDQAEWATRHINNYAGLDLSNPRKYTFLFEIIYPGNRIVIDYGNFEGLIMLGAVEIETGYVIGPYEAAALLQWPGLITDVMPHRSISDVLAADDRENTEGYVIRAGNKMVKWKREEYIRIHAIASNLTKSKVLSLLASDQDIEKHFEILPDELYAIAKGYRDELLDEYGAILVEIMKRYQELDKTLARREFAWSIRDELHRPAFFSLLDGKSIVDYIWTKVKLQNK